MKILFSKRHNIDELSQVNINVTALQELRDRLKKEQPTIEMASYLSKCDQSHQCATACCLAGWGLEWKIGTTPELDSRWKKAVQLHENDSYVGWEYTGLLLGDPHSDLFDWYFNWLFSGLWDNDLDQAIQRLDYFIEHKTVPALFTLINGQYHKRYTNINIIELMSQLDNSMLVTSTTYTVEDGSMVVECDDGLIAGPDSALRQLEPDLIYEQEAKMTTYISSMGIIVHETDIAKFNELVRAHITM